MPICDKCGKRGLTWIDSDWGWMLYLGASPHFCGKWRRLRAVQAFYRGLYELRKKGKKAA
jgi:hypothetical protein